MAYNKINVNHNYFNNIDTEQKAYWLGFLSADGCISGNSIGILLKKDDVDHLYKFRNDIESGHTISISEKYKRCSFKFRSNVMKNDLYKLGVCERKSLTLKSCYNKIPEGLQKDYWRGVIDGDGYLANRNGQTVIGFCGTLNMIKSFKRYVNGFIYCNSKISRLGRIYRIYLYGNNAINIMTLLYKNSNIYLDRKYEIAEKVIYA